MSGITVAPKTDKPIEKEAAKIGANDSSSQKIAEPASGKVEKADHPAKGKSVQRPAESIPAPVAKAAKSEKPAVAGKPEATASKARTDEVQPAIGPPGPPTAAPEAPAPKDSISVAPPAAKPPKPAPAQKPAAKGAKKPREYKVVAASFSTEAGAGELVNRLKAENYSPTVVQADLPKGRYYRVIVGSHGSLSEAHAEMAELKKRGLQPFCIVE